MTTRQLLVPLVSLLTPLFVVAAAEAAPPMQATARAARSTVQVGEPVRITIKVTNSEEVPQIDAPTVDGMSITLTGTGEVSPSVLRNVRPLSTGHVPGSKILDSLRDLSKQLGDVPGGMPNGADPQLTQQYQAMLKQGLGNINRSDYSIVYLATPEQTGAVTIPAFTVHSNGQTMQTQPLSLTVVEARPSPWVKAALSLSNPRPFVGDTVNLYVDLLVRRPTAELRGGNADLKSQPINNVTLKVPVLEGHPEIRPLESLAKYVEKRRLPPRQLGYHINDCPGVILMEQEPARGASETDPEWYRRRLTIPFRVVQGGEIELPPLRVAGEVYVAAGGKNRYTWEGFVSSSDPLKFRILDVANKPADYNGTIGPCRLSAVASRTDMPAGTPFTLTLREEANRSQTNITRPNLEAIPAFRDHFVIREEKDIRRSAFTREFTWTLRPRSETVTEVPPISVSWFDPQSEKFERTHSEAIPLHVTPAPVPKAAPKVAAAAPPRAEEPAAPGEEAPPLVKHSFPRTAAYLAAFAVVLVLAGVGVGLRRRVPKRRQAARLRQRRQAVAQARQRLQTSPLAAAAVSAAVQDFLRAHLEMAPGEITPEEAAEQVTQAGYPADLAEACAEVLRACADRQFAPGQTADHAEDLAVAAGRILAALLAARPQEAKAVASPVDELTRERQAALAD